MDKSVEMAREAWVEPAITALEIDETALFPNIGADGSSFPDCTRS
jgi:hypothetical protein